FFDGRLMVFGDGDDEVFTGFTGSVSIIGHELSHGVISHTADLEYSGQPGALNEHCADVFGALTEQHAAGQNAEDADWLIGAGIFTAEVSGRALRSMIEPGTPMTTMSSAKIRSRATWTTSSPPNPTTAASTSTRESPTVRSRSPPPPSAVRPGRAADRS